jgi:SAM-dependent methyltransferase
MLKTIFKRLLGPKCFSLLRDIYFSLRPLWYLGNKRTCPCCNWRFRKFLPYGPIIRDDVLCPRCGSLERHRLLILYLKNRTNFFEDDLKVLDIAPMEFFQKMCKKMKNIDYISADIASELAMMKMDITDIQLDDNQFDCIICYHVFEHIIDDIKAMREIYRVLKPGGWAILQVPIDNSLDKTLEDPTITSPEERARIFGQDDHVRIYGKDYKERLESAGFIVKDDDYIQELDDLMITKSALLKNEVMYYCSRPE